MTDATGPAGRALCPPQRGPSDHDCAPPRTEFPAGRDCHKTAAGHSADWCDDALLDELRRVAVMAADKPLTIARFNLMARVSYDTVRHRFGGWRQALERAGLGHRYSGRKVTQKQRLSPSRNLSDAAVLEEMRRLARAKGGAPLLLVDVDASPRLARSTLVSRFGSWAEALRRAGLRQARLGRRFTGQQCFDNLAAMWARLGRAPTMHEMRRAPSRVGPRAYVQRFGGWRATVDAFLRRIDAGRGDAQAQRAARAEWELPRRRGDAAAPGTLSGEVKPPRRTRRPLPPMPRRGEDRPSGRMRFKVFERDRFRCVACGNSPATDPACKLHVDHIEPYSKGGRTTLDNLRTLCAACNWSRGDGG